MKDAASAPEEATLTEVVAPHDAFRIALPNFEGPLDLLLHLIREHKLDILDIPIALVTEKYLAHIELMREINLDIAGEFLVMASTLLHLKSRMLLPREDQPGLDGASEEQGDPRAELVRRLLEYQKYKDAADQLARNDLLGRTVFARAVSHETVPLEEGELGLKEISVFKLIEALDRVLKALEPEKQHEVTREHLSLGDAMYRIADRIRASGLEGKVTFKALFDGAQTRGQVIVTFLAMLEMCKMRLLRVFQAEEGEEIFLSSRGDALEGFGIDAPVVPETVKEELDREYQ